jgi:hypothetical protein
MIYNKIDKNKLNIMLNQFDMIMFITIYVYIIYKIRKKSYWNLLYILLYIFLKTLYIKYITN